MPPHASVKKGVSVLRNAQASGPHVVTAWSCKLREEIKASVSLPGGLSPQLGERILWSKRGPKSNQWLYIWLALAYRPIGSVGECCRAAATRVKEEKLIKACDCRGGRHHFNSYICIFVSAACFQKQCDHTHTHLILQRRCPCHAAQWGLSINEQREGQMTVSRSQWTHSSFPAELWFGATETKPHSTAQIKRCFFSPQLPMRGSWSLIEGEFAVRSLNVWQTVEDNGRDKFILPTHVSFEPDVTDVPQTHTSNWWRKNPKQFNIGTLVADITGLRPFCPSVNWLLLSLLC